MLSQQHELQDRIEGCLINSLNQRLGLHITIHDSTPLLPPSLHLEFEFTTRDVPVTAEIAVDVINGSLC